MKTTRRGFLGSALALALSPKLAITPKAAVAPKMAVAPKLLLQPNVRMVTLKIQDLTGYCSFSRDFIKDQFVDLKQVLVAGVS